MNTVELCDGKYRITEDNGIMVFYRNDELWQSATEDFRYSKVILALVTRVAELEELNNIK